MNNDTPETIAVELVAPAALESLERAQLDIQIATARKYPRNLVAVKKEMMSMATTDIETAESCFYNLPRGGKSIPGPSIRLAEIALSCFGNVRAATRIIGASLGDDPHVVIQAVCHDLEKNSAISIEKRRRITKKKHKDAPDEDDINLATNACSAIALRDAIFKIVPGVLVNPAYDAAKRVAIGDDKTLVDRRALAVASLAKMGVTPDRLCAALEIKSVEEINLAHLETLTGLRNAIRDNQLTLDSAFPQIVKVAPIFGATPPVPTPTPTSNPVNPAHPVNPVKNTPAQSPLSTPKTLLADWMIKNHVTYAELQPLLVHAGKFPWADSTGSFEELTAENCAAILKNQKDLEAALLAADDVPA